MRTTKGLAAALAAALGLLACGGDGPSAPSAAGGAGTFPSGDVRLSYALDLPASTPPHPAFVLGHGSGRATKEEATPLARRLTALGFAVLRYDKRGVGASTGTYENVGVANSDRMIGALGEDLAAGVAFLAGRADIDARRIGLVGFSQAGWVMPAAAARSGRVRFMVLLSSPTVSVGEEIFFSSLAENTTTPLDEISARLRGYTGPRGYDPRADLEQLAIPALWVLGGQDRSIPTRETVAVLQELRNGGHAYEWVVYPGAGHDLTDVQSRVPVDYMPDLTRFVSPYR